MASLFDVNTMVVDNWSDDVMVVVKMLNPWGDRSVIITTFQVV